MHLKKIDIFGGFTQFSLQRITLDIRLTDVGLICFPPVTYFNKWHIWWVLSLSAPTMSPIDAPSGKKNKTCIFTAHARPPLKLICFCQNSNSLRMRNLSLKHHLSPLKATVCWLVSDGMGGNTSGGCPCGIGGHWGASFRKARAAFIGHASHKAGGVFLLSYCPNEYVGLQIQALLYIMCWFSPIIVTLLGATPEFRQICMNSRANEGNTFKLVPVQRSNPEVSFKRLD